MSQPLEKVISKTMFIVEGNPNAVLVIEDALEMSNEHLWFPAPEHALTWCRRNACNLVYSHADISGN
jgi:hypothetical protein